MVTPDLIDDPLVQRLARDLRSIDGAETWQLKYAWQAVAYQRMMAYTVRYGIEARDAAQISSDILRARCILWPEAETQLALSQADDQRGEQRLAARVLNDAYHSLTPPF